MYPTVPNVKGYFENKKGDPRVRRSPSSLTRWVMSISFSVQRHGDGEQRQSNPGRNGPGQGLLFNRVDRPRYRERR